LRRDLAARFFFAREQKIGAKKLIPRNSPKTVQEKFPNLDVQEILKKSGKCGGYGTHPWIRAPGKGWHCAAGGHFVSDDEVNKLCTQARLVQMGRCQSGFDWVKVSDGWRCGGGAHFVSDAQLKP